MSKKKREQSPEGAAAAPTSQVRPLVPVMLIGISAVASMLALYQWMELLVVRAGGTAACAVNSVVNCQKVWEAPLASAVHNTLGVPVAGMGLVWALAAFGGSLVFAHGMLGGRSTSTAGAALKVIAWVGLISIPVLAAVAFSSGAVCILCLVTYVVVAAFALVALKLVPGGAVPKTELKGGVSWAGGLALVAYLVLLGPGLATPKKGGDAGGGTLGNLPSADLNTPKPQTPPTPQQPQQPQAPLSPEDQAVANFLARLSPLDQQVVSNGLAIYQNGTVPVASPPKARRIFGAEDAPIKVVEWVDFRCGACRNLNETMKELKRVAPSGSLSVEARNFPLDAECNPEVQRTDGSGISCTAAKASICLEPTKDYWKLRDRLFTPGITKAQIIEVASSGELGRAKLEQCLASPETAKALREDIEYAMAYDIHGTPMLVVNGKEISAGGSDAFLYALSLTNGNAQSPAFRSLPPPRAMSAHEGHGH